MKPNRIAVTLMLGMASLAVAAESGDTIARPIVSSYALEIGGATLADTYLTPMRYHGTRLALSGGWKKRLPAAPERLSMMFDADIEGAFTTNPVGNARMYLLEADFDWGMLYHFYPAQGWTIAAGASVGFDAGVMYLPRNGNNPASAIADLHLSLNARADLQTRIRRVPVVVADAVTLPSLSAFFTPQFGESYYEIYLGNRDSLAHAGWWGNRFGIDNLLSADFIFGRRALTVGYRYRIDTSWANSLSSRRESHSLVIGVTFGAEGNKLAKEISQ